LQAKKQEKETDNFIYPISKVWRLTN